MRFQSLRLQTQHFFDTDPKQCTTVDGSETWRSPVEVGRLSHCLHSFVHPCWCRTSSIKNIIYSVETFQNYYYTYILASSLIPPKMVRGEEQKKERKEQQSRAEERNRGEQSRRKEQRRAADKKKETGEEEQRKETEPRKAEQRKDRVERAKESTLRRKWCAATPKTRRLSRSVDAQDPKVPHVGAISPARPESAMLLLKV